MSLRTQLAAIKVDSYTTPMPYAVGPSTTTESIIAIMAEHSIRHLPVVEDGLPIGIISERDVHCANSYQGPETHATARDIMTISPYMVAKNSSLEQVAFEMSDRKIGSAIVIEDDRTMSGIFTSTDALNALVEVLRGEIAE